MLITKRRCIAMRHVACDAFAEFAAIEASEGRRKLDDALRHW